MLHSHLQMPIHHHHPPPPPLAPPQNFVVDAWPYSYPPSQPAHASLPSPSPAHVLATFPPTQLALDVLVIFDIL